MAEDIAEHAAEQILGIAAVEVEGAVRTASGIFIGAAGTGSRPAALKGGKPVSVVQFSFFGVAQDRVGFAHFLELLFCVPVSRVYIRMIFLSELSVSGLQLFVVSGSRDAQNFITVSFQMEMLTALS